MSREYDRHVIATLSRAGVDLSDMSDEYVAGFVAGFDWVGDEALKSRLERAEKAIGTFRRMIEDGHPDSKEWFDIGCRAIHDYESALDPAPAIEGKEGTA